MSPNTLPTLRIQMLQQSLKEHRERLSRLQKGAPHSRQIRRYIKALEKELAEIGSGSHS